MIYWIEFILVMIPGFLFTLISVLPLGFGLLVAVHHLRRGVRIMYLRNLYGSIAAGIVALLLLFGSLFGDDLSSSSTAALIFLFVPVYATLALGVVYGISALLLGKPETTESISSVKRKLILIPITILLILIVGILKNSLQGNDRAIAYGASNSDILVQLYNKSLHGEADSFSIPLGLTQNPNTPPEILRQLATHEHRAIRTKVVQHKSTPIDVVSSLRNDSNLCVRKAVSRRLGVPDSNKTVEPIKTPRTAF